MVTATKHFQSAAALAPTDPAVREWLARVEGVEERLRDFGAPAKPGLGDGAWRKNVSEAAEVMRDPVTKRKARANATTLLVSHGFTELTPTESGVWGRVARELERMDLARSLDDLETTGGPDSDELNGPIACVERLCPGADTLVLVFTGARQDVFFSLDVFHRHLASAGVSAVYLRNRSRNFYAFIEGLGDSFTETVERFREIKARAGASRLLVIGYCMGVAGALNYGKALRAEAVICFKPFLTMPRVEDLPPALVPMATALRDANPEFQAFMPEFEFDAHPAPRVTLVTHSELDADARIARDLSEKWPNVQMIETCGGVTSDCFVGAAASGLLWPLLEGFLAHGSVAPEIARALETGG